MTITTIPTIPVQTDEMDNMLLRKVEELTLYVIELKKENEEEQIKNEALLNEINEIKNKQNI